MRHWGIEPRDRRLHHHLAPFGAGALFVWGALLGLAPLVAVVVSWQTWHDVLASAAAGGLAGAAVVALFGATAGRAL